MAGRLAPFIELGVGFNARADRARERRPQRRDDGPDAAARRGAASTRSSSSPSSSEFVDLKLKNYSSGMLVRLAFSVMMQADADILLIDEVLAVGDAAFQQKCADAFHEMKDGRRRSSSSPTTWRRSRSYCHRAMLLDDGEIAHIGDPSEVGTPLPAPQLRARRRASRGATGGGAARRGRAARSTPGSRTRRAPRRQPRARRRDPPAGRAGGHGATSPRPSVGFIDHERRRGRRLRFGTPLRPRRAMPSRCAPASGSR